MITKYFILLLFFLISHCAAPGIALLSPAVTGVKTKSAQQASISLGSSLSSNQIIKKVDDKIKKDTIKKAKKILDKIKNLNENKLSYQLNK